MNKRVLLIDDELNVLSALKRQLRKMFVITTATGGKEALQLVETSPTFAVVVCDMRMPDMDGVETLKAIAARSPNTTRIMLTGNADQQTVVDAINDGRIFRFFSKPCSSEALQQGIADGLRQHQLVVAEKELLEKTLAGSVKLMTDLLVLAEPQVFEKTTRVRNWAKKIGQALEMDNRWQLDLAAMLSPIGLVAMPKTALSRSLKPGQMSPAEQALMTNVPKISRDLIMNIPRLKDVAEIVYYQNKNFDGSGYPDGEVKGDEIPLISRLLRILNALAACSDALVPGEKEFHELARQPECFDPQMVALVRKVMAAEVKIRQDEFTRISIDIGYLREGDVMQQDLMSREGRLLLAQGSEITRAQCRSLTELAELKLVTGQVSVLRRESGQKTDQSEAPQPIKDLSF